MTGKVLVWCIQAVVIGGALWLVYILIKRLVRKATGSIGLGSIKRLVSGDGKYRKP